MVSKTYSICFCCNFRWSHSRALMYGSLVLLTKDKFRSDPIWATVENCDKERMVGRTRPKISISIFQGT